MYFSAVPTQAYALNSLLNQTFKGLILVPKGRKEYDMNEKVKLGETAYDLVTNGAIFEEDKVQLIFVLPEGKSFEQVEADLTNNDRIIIMDQEGETIESRAGYPYLKKLTKQKNYIIGVDRVEGKEAVSTDRNVTATVMTAVLKRSDIRQELASIRETVDILVLSQLGRM